MLRLLVTGANGQLGSWMRNLACANENFIFSDLAVEPDCTSGAKMVSRYECLDITDLEVLTNV